MFSEPMHFNAVATGPTKRKRTAAGEELIGEASTANCFREAQGSTAEQQ